MPLPQSEIARIHDQEDAFLIKTWVRKPGRPPIIVRGEGCYLWDATGKKYLDFTSQLQNVNIGYGNRKVIEAIKKQAEELAYVSGAYASVPRARLAERLQEIAPKGLTRSFFTCDGAEAVESAIKIAKEYTRRPKVVSLWQAYHGSTLGTLSAGGVTGNRTAFEPLVPGFTHVSPPYCYRCDLNLEYPDCDMACARLVEKIIKWEDPKTVAAFVAEPVLGAGFIVPPKEYLKIVREICDDLGVLMILDEVMTGFGRTGKLFACEHSGVVPDILVVGKGITSGYVPLSAAVVKDEIGKMFLEKSPTHGFTYSGHPLCCAAALACIDVIIEEGLVENAAKTGEHLLNRIKGFEEKYKCVGEARGLGLLDTVEFVKDKRTRQLLGNSLTDKDVGVHLSGKAAERGVLIGATRFAPSTVRLAPPLTITEKEIDNALDVIEESIADLDKRLP